VQPSLTQIPKIIEFLGRDPFEKKAENLGDKIREYRRVHGLMQKKLAEQLGVDQTTLAGWERGQRDGEDGLPGVNRPRHVPHPRQRSGDGPLLRPLRKCPSG
jgi:hypothetical protein